jgi:uncharacterized protein (DUF302 family)
MESRAAATGGKQAMLYRVESSKKVSEVARDMEAAAQRNKFGVLGVHDLRAKMKEKGVAFDRECLVFEVCNPHQAKKVLEQNPDISTALPCRISVYSEGTKTVLATIRPTALISMYKAHGLETVAQEVETSIQKIMQEAAE